MMVCAPLVVPRFWVNVNADRLKLATACARLPVNGTDCEVPPPLTLPAASSFTVSVPVRAFLSSGPIWPSVIVIWQLLWAGITLGQLLL